MYRKSVFAARPYNLYHGAAKLSLSNRRVFQEFAKTRYLITSKSKLLKPTADISSFEVRVVKARLYLDSHSKSCTVLAPALAAVTNKNSFFGL